MNDERFRTCILNIFYQSGETLAAVEFHDLWQIIRYKGLPFITGATHSMMLRH
jgi:hypothetical protein